MINLDKIKPSNLWYIIGYIATDGSLSVDGRHINITSKDRDHLYKIRCALLLENTIGRKTRSISEERNYSQLQLGDVNFYKYLQSLGFTTRKSLTLGKININNLFFNDFLRGIVDGDGNISTWIHRTNNHAQWTLRIYSAAPSFINWIKAKIEEEFSINGKLYVRLAKNRTNPIYILKFGKIAARNILKQIYYPECLSLERKFLKAQMCLQSSFKMIN